MKTKKRWRRIADSKIRHVWVMSDLCVAEHGFDIDEDRVVVDPSFYANNGVPICGDCGVDREYSHTEILG